MADVPSNLIPTRVTQLPVAPVADENSLMMIVYQGNNYQIRVGDLLSVAGVPTSRQVIAGTGLQGGGQLSSNVTLSIAPGGVGTSQLANSGVTPGSYGTATDIPVLTVDATGRVVAATTIPAVTSGFVPTSRQVIAGTGLNGGGALNNNVTLNANLSSAAPLAGFQAGSAGVSTDISRADHKHPAVNLAVDDEVDGILGLGNGGTARSLVPDEGAIIWCGADGLYVGPVGAAGQVLQSTGVGEYVWVSQSALNVGQADNLNGGGANRIAYQTATGVTGFISAPVSSDTFLKWDGSQLVWGAVAGAGTVTSVNASGGTTGMSFSGGPITASGTLTLAGTLITANGGTGLSSFAAGDTLYYAAGDALSKLSIGSSTYMLTSSGTAPQWTDPATVTVGSATTASSATSATTATNVAGGAANQLVYNTGAGATSFVTAPTVANTYLEWSGSAFQWSANPLGSVTSVGLSLPSEFTVTNSPVTTSGTLTGAWASQTANYFLAAPNGSPGTPAFRAIVAADIPTLNQNTTGQAGSVASSVTFDSSGTGGASPQTFNGSAAVTVSRNTLGAAASGANSDITSMSGVTGGISTPDFIQFDAALSPLPTAATGKVFYDNSDQFQTLSFQMNGSIEQHIGEEQFFRVKCSSGVTKGQVVMFTGTLGASGGLTAAPATGLTPEQANYILGVALETGATNDWIFVSSFGEVKDINTTGGAESWVQGQVLYYNPAVAGGLTKTKPTTPAAIAVMAAVVHVGTSNGILFVRPTFGSVLGGTDGNVQFGTLNNGDVIVYDSTDQRWENVAQSTLSVGSAATATSATTATNLAGGIASQIPYQTGAGATSFIANGTAGYVLKSNGTSAPSWATIDGGTF